jgi:peptide/nickel transport system permease protein
MLSLLLGLVVWTTLARMLRAEVLSLREREFVHAARALGATRWQVAVAEILPNIAGTVLVNATLIIPTAVLLESTISFVGLGVQPPDVSLGRLISDYQDALLVRPWLFWWPSVFIVALTASLSAVGEGLREALDPRRSTPAAGR